MLLSQSNLFQKQFSENISNIESHRYKCWTTNVLQYKFLILFRGHYSYTMDFLINKNHSLRECQEEYHFNQSFLDSVTPLAGFTGHFSNYKKTTVWRRKTYLWCYIFTSEHVLWKSQKKDARISPFSSDECTIRYQGIKQKRVFWTMVFSCYWLSLLSPCYDSDFNACMFTSK